MRTILKAFPLFAIVLFSAAVYFAPAPTFAADAQPPKSGGAGTFLCVPVKGGQGQDLYGCINKLYRFTLVIGAIGAVGVVTAAGYLYMNGGSEQVSQAKSMISTSIWGLVIFIASYAFLRMINPALVEFRSIQPPTVADVILPTPNSFDKFYCEKFPDLCKDGVPKSGPGQIGGTERTGGSVNSGNGAGPGTGQTAAALTAAGCNVTAGEVGRMADALYSRVLEICKKGKAFHNANKGKSKEVPRISSITGGEHSPGSLHYIGCATDFGNNPSDPDGQNIISTAQSLGMVINPGSDAHQDNHIHVSLGSYCGKASGSGSSSGGLPPGINAWSGTDPLGLDWGPKSAALQAALNTFKSKYS